MARPWSLQAGKRHLYHYLHTVDISGFVTGGAQPKLNQGNLNRIPVRIPTSDKRTRIVDQLDAFEVLLDDPSGGVLAELALRKKQFAYYRDQLLALPARVDVEAAT